MCIRNWYLPNRYVRRHRRQKLAQRQRNNQPEVVGPRDVHILPDAPQIEERSTVDGDAQQLDHGDRHRIWEVAEQHFADDIIARRHDVPEEAQRDHGDHLLGDSTLEGHFSLIRFSRNGIGQILKTVTKTNGEKYRARPHHYGCCAEIPGYRIATLTTHHEANTLFTMRLMIPSEWRNDYASFEGDKL